MAHFHYTVFGTVVFIMFTGFCFWWPKMTRQDARERLGGGTSGCCSGASDRSWCSTGWARRACLAVTPDYLPGRGSLLNQVSSLGALILRNISTLFFLYNVYKTWRFAPNVTVDDPVG